MPKGGAVSAELAVVAPFLRFAMSLLLPSLASGAVMKESESRVATGGRCLHRLLTCKDIEPAIIPTRNALAKMSVSRPTGCGDG